MVESISDKNIMHFLDRHEFDRDMKQLVIM